ncbi:hypothetical protein GQ43DRAFT_285910 [Delitschia confertaspora ATCC 74209]|uniref:Uncharacterized protein n=1 Tax=Delitschia confertaspora ATCC 74209 TaxID=1513339 RepID=A0A9P4JG01_9PLEO|nr:hypothetical protein GQ43DRAFT_285910 [Delitschia confertaspora ATCC 74209]
MNKDRVRCLDIVVAPLFVILILSGFTSLDITSFSKLLEHVLFHCPINRIGGKDTVYNGLQWPAKSCEQQRQSLLLNKASGPITRSQSQPQSRAGSRMAGQDTWDNFAALDNSFKAAGYDYFDPGEATINDGPYYGRRQSQNLIQTPLVSIPSVGTQSQSIDRSDWTFEQFVDESRYPALVVSGVIPNDPQLQSARSTPKSTQSQRSSYSIDHGSDGSELKKSRRVKHKHYSVAQYDKPEKPMVNESKPWVRVNSSTKGLTTRTTKINHYDPQETYTYGLEHPLGNWKGPTTKFRSANSSTTIRKTSKAQSLQSGFRKPVPTLLNVTLAGLITSVDSTSALCD